MPDLKFRNRQTRVSLDQLRERVRLIACYVDLTRAFCDLVFTGRDPKSGPRLETILVLACVTVSEAEGRSTSVTKLASYSGLPRQTVYRRLEELIDLGKVVRSKKSYCLAENAVSPDRRGQLARILDKLR
jgi:hypothetical protein